MQDGTSVATISETDLVAFLNQFCTEALFAKAIKYFTAHDRKFFFCLMKCAVFKENFGAQQSF